jgi:hypothetical protein
MQVYLTLTMSVRAQTIKDKAPRRSAYEGSDEKIEKYTYKGEVPISP